MSEFSPGCLRSKHNVQYMFDGKKLNNNMLLKPSSKFSLTIFNLTSLFARWNEEA